MAFAHYLLAVPVEPSRCPKKPSISNPSFSISSKCLNFSSSLFSRAHKHSIFARFDKIGHKGKNLKFSFLLYVCVMQIKLVLSSHCHCLMTNLFKSLCRVPIIAFFNLYWKFKFDWFHLNSAKAKPQEPEVSVATDAFTQFKHLLLPITDRNPYLSEGTRQVSLYVALCFSVFIYFSIFT